MSGFVLDNSVTMRWCFEDDSPYAVGILYEIRSGRIAHVPTLWLYEVISVMAESRWRGHLSTERAHAFLDDLRSLPIEIDAVSSKELVLSDAYRLATKHG